MIIDTLNLNHLRIFDCVFRHQNMTEAAKELHMTQSGVSQHIKSLEEMLEVKLFDRIKKRLIPTNDAHQLQKRCSVGLSEIELGLQEIKDQTKDLTGTVAIGMPVEFGNSMLLPLIAKFALKNPRVKFKIELGLASTLSQWILDGRLDFAIVDDFALDRRISTKKIFDEVLGLYIHENLLEKVGKPKSSLSYFEALDYIEYEEGESVLRMWFNHHFKTNKVKLNVRATILDVQSVARLIESGIGAGILPSHVADKLNKAGHKLYGYKGCGQPLKNTIRMAWLDGRTLSPSSQATAKWITESLSTLSN